MNVKILKGLLVLVVIVVAAYFIIDLFSFGDDVEIGNVSVETKEKFADLIFEQIRSSETIIEDSLAKSDLDIITNKLLSNLDSTNYLYEFYLLDNPQMNAFAIPGGKIFIFKGLIKELESTEQLAAVLSHEIGHIEEKHVLKKLVAELGIDIILGGDESIGGAVGKMMMSFSFSRSIEEDADDFGLKLLDRSDVDPRVMGEVFAKFYEKEIDSDFLEFFRTHPLSKTRVRNALQYKISNSDRFDTIPVDWQSFKDNIVTYSSTF